MRVEKNSVCLIGRQIYIKERIQHTTDSGLQRTVDKLLKYRIENNIINNRSKQTEKESCLLLIVRFDGLDQLVT
jgi:hypothetical protein